VTGSRARITSPLPAAADTISADQVDITNLPDYAIRVCLGGLCGTVSSHHPHHHLMNPDCNPAEQQARQDKLDRRYEEDGRHDPEHPMHCLYTGLMEAAE
jgi:hypothetical protein